MTRRALRSSATLVTCLLTACATPPQPTSSSIRELDASAAILARAAQIPGAVVRVVAYRLDGRGPRIAINPDSLVHAASTMKIPVMIALAQRAEIGRAHV